MKLCIQETFCTPKPTSLLEEDIQRNLISWVVVSFYYFRQSKAYQIWKEKLKYWDSKSPAKDKRLPVACNLSSSWFCLNYMESWFFIYICWRKKKLTNLYQGSNHTKGLQLPYRRDHLWQFDFWQLENCGWNDANEVRECHLQVMTTK